MIAQRLGQTSHLVALALVAGGADSSGDTRPSIPPRVVKLARRLIRSVRLPGSALTCSVTGMFLRTLRTVTPEDGPELPGRYDAAQSCRVDAAGVPVVLSGSVAHTRTETKAMRDPSDADENPGWRLRAVGTVTKEAGSDRDASSVPLTITKTAGGRDADRMGAIALSGTETRGSRDRD